MHPRYTVAKLRGVGFNRPLYDGVPARQPRQLGRSGSTLNAEWARNVGELGVKPRDTVFV